MKDLRHFEEAKSKILVSLQEAERFVEKLGMDKVAEDLQMTLQTLTREQFEIIVAGEFSNGKSTFLNALLEEEILPSSIVPTTALINKIYYREQPRFEVHYQNGKVKNLTRKEFLDFVSEDKKKVDGESKPKLRDTFHKVSHLEIGYPTTICKNGIVLIDSPGTNEMSEQRVQITNEYIPRSDAAIFLLNASQIFKASEKAFLQRILDADIKKVFFVINFKDMIKTEEEFKEIEQIVKDNLPEGLEAPKIFFVSALYALNHYKKLNSPEEVKPLGRRAQRKQAKVLSIEETGILQFEQQLMQFLSSESGIEKLRKPVERAVRLLTFVSEEHIQFERHSLNHNIDDIDLRVAKIETQLKKVERDIDSRAKQMIKKIDSENKSIIRWYSSELSKVADIAEMKLNEGIRLQEDPEIIKSNIDLATGMIEKQISEQLSKKMEEVVNGTIMDENRQLDQQLGHLTLNLVQSAGNKEEWGEAIVRRERQVKKQVEEASVGAAVVGGLALFFTGGSVGWGLVGAGLAGATYQYITEKEDNASMYGRLKSQVKGRYKGSVSKQTKNLERELKEITRQLINEYKKVVQAKIEQERNRSQMLIKNHNLEAEEVQQKIASLNRDEQMCKSMIHSLEKEFNRYMYSVSGNEVKQHERATV